MRYVASLMLLLAACDRPKEPPAAPQARVNIFAASSLRETVTAVASEWSKRTGRPTWTPFEASSTLARQIREGAPFDGFVPAAPE